MPMNSKPLWKRFWESINKNFYYIANTGIPPLLAILTLVHDKEVSVNLFFPENPNIQSVANWMFYWLKIALLVLLFLIQFQQMKKKYGNDNLIESLNSEIESLKNDNENASQIILNLETTIADLEEKTNREKTLLTENCNTLLYGYISEFAYKKLHFSKSSTMNERITLFVPGGNGDLVILIRFSLNTTFATKSRDSYPVLQGVISKAWDHDWFFVNDIPCPIDDTKCYYEYNKNTFKISKKLSKELKMKSRLLCGCRITDSFYNPIGLVVVESLSPNRFVEQELKDALENQKYILSSLLTNLKPYLSLPEIAKMKGI